MSVSHMTTEDGAAGAKPLDVSNPVAGRCEVGGYSRLASCFWTPKCTLLSAIGAPRNTKGCTTELRVWTNEKRIFRRGGNSCAWLRISRRRRRRDRDEVRTLQPRAGKRRDVEAFGMGQWRGRMLRDVHSCPRCPRAAEYRNRVVSRKCEELPWPATAPDIHYKRNN
jgi:hypothetical protein